MNEKEVRLNLRQRCKALFNAVDGIHANWNKGECPADARVMNCARKTFNGKKVSLLDLMKAGRSLYRLWSVFKDDYEDTDYRDDIHDYSRVFRKRALRSQAAILSYYRG